MNPYETMFGKEPKEYIPRFEETEKILQSFGEQECGCYLISGVRGMGKTVILSHIAKELSKQDEWLVIDINPEKDILTALAAKLYSKAKLGRLFLNKSFSIGADGFSLTLSNGTEIIDPENAVEIMVTEIKKMQKKLLITIDEATSSKEMRIFIHTFQSLVRLSLPVFLLMTGLGENIYSLQNEKTLTFLYRAPKLVLSPLQNVSVFNGYARIFGDELAKEMTKLVSGYAFAYQLLGSIVYRNKSKGIGRKELDEFDEGLSEYAYAKIWNEFSETDKKIIRSIFANKGSTKLIMQNLGMEKSKFSVYRDRLKQKGYLDVSARGKLGFILPRFDRFLEKYDY